MTKREVAKQLRALLARAIRSLPDDIEYKCASIHEDSTTVFEREHEEQNYSGELGALHIIEFIVEEEPDNDKETDE